MQCFTYLKTQALPVLIAVIGTRTMSGLISLAYRKVKPRKPTGKKRLKRNKKALATETQEAFGACDAAPATMAMQVPMPMAEIIISFLRPKRSTVRTPIGEQQVWKVNRDAVKTRAMVPERPRYCLKIVVWCRTKRD